MYVRPARTVAVTSGLWEPKLNSLHFPRPLYIYIYIYHMWNFTQPSWVPLLLSIKLVSPTFVQFMHEWN